LATELPGLITGLSDRLGQIDLVGYHLGAWDGDPAAPRDRRPHPRAAGRQLRRAALLVIPPDADEQAARQQLNATAERADGDVAAYQQVVREGGSPVGLSRGER
jgi:hypothetical protein